jgi:dihydropteroate synthase
MPLRLIELQGEQDSLLAGRAIGRVVPEPNWRGWAAILSPAPAAALLEGMRHAGLAVLRGGQGAIALGSLAQLWSAGRSLAVSLERPEGREPAAELEVRAAAVEAGAAAAGLGPLGPPGASGAPGAVGARLPASGGPPGWRLPRSTLPTGRTLVMGVLNVTPDSFSDGGAFLDPAAAVERGCALEEAGADLLDVGGESTNPFRSEPVDAAEERRRVEPVLRALAKRVRVPIAVDTTKAEVAAAALDAGAEVVNDVSGLVRDPALGLLAAERGAGLVLMHMRGTPQTMRSLARYDDLLGEVLGELEQALARAAAAGVATDRICLDPGLGFAKEAVHSLELVRRLRELSQLGRPLLLGPSRKSFLGAATGRPVGERLHATVAASALCAANGAAIVRAHDVGEVRDALAVADAVRAAGGGRP